ncbi:hypothetical protein POTOM_038213 [Populus tomentosa]|uniref:Uncharacterized protein n=1 Tax=Populus tomentosa TaxID=118781 RepID=A0A8X7YY84_POPTO|nr:hypothetical protein POTOM_038213 [Populus tomentosa]
MHPLQANQDPTTPPHPLTSQLQYPHSEKKTSQCSDQSIETVLFNHKTNDEVKSNGHDDALKSFVRSSQEEEKIEEDESGVRLRMWIRTLGVLIRCGRELVVNVSKN